MVVRMRHTRSHTANRRSHHALKGQRFSKCVKCGAQHLRHRVCLNCGSYKGREVIDVMAKTNKKLAKTAKTNAPKSPKIKVPKKAKKVVAKPGAKAKVAKPSVSGGGKGS